MFKMYFFSLFPFITLLKMQNCIDILRLLYAFLQFSSNAFTECTFYSNVVFRFKCSLLEIKIGLEIELWKSTHSK